MAPRLIVLGWDSATWDVADELLDAGKLPVLGSLIERGFRAPLRSTWPPMTDSAWTCAFTGRNAGAHGIFGSWYRAPGRYECRYFSSRDRRAPALWELTEGLRHVVWNVPMSFPPTEVEGAMVASYGAPPGARFCNPAELQERLGDRWPLEDLLDRAPHSSLARFLDDLLRGLKAQAQALPWIVRETSADCLVAVWPHIDRAQHFFWRRRNSDHELSDAVERVYVAMDEATGAVVEAFPDSDVMVVSDHGAGPLKGDVNLGAWLAAGGHATYGPAPRGRLVDLAWKMPPGVRRWGRRLAPGLAREAFSKTLTGQLGSFDWAATDAFLGFHSDLWLNLQGRELSGTVAPADAPELLAELKEGLLGLHDPRTGEPVFAAAHERAEIFSGDCAEMAPDLMLDSWSAGYRVAPARERSDEFVIPPAPLAGVHEAWSADHRPLGIFVAAGPRIAGGRSEELDLYDVCPTALALLGQPVPADLDGRAATETIDSAWLGAHPLVVAGASAPRASGGEYSADEAAAVAAHLKDLGYIE